MTLLFKSKNSRILGPSALAGIVFFVIIAPINHRLNKRGLKIYQDLTAVSDKHFIDPSHLHRVLKARDKRMSVLNEVISEVKFIKYLASEEQWIGKVMMARSHELAQILKST